MYNFNFIIKGRSFTFSLNSKQYGHQLFVETNAFRPAECSEHKIDPNNPIAAAFAGEQDFTLKEEFEIDLGNQVEWINASSEQPSIQVFFDACCMACQQHIARHGRLFIADLFTYLDVFALLLNTCFGQTKEETCNMYLECTKTIGHALSQYIKCHIGYGAMVDFDTWAQSNGL